MKLNIITVVFFIAIGNVFAQRDFHGVATYKTQRKVDVSIDSTELNPEMYKRAMDMLKKQFQKTYILEFNKEASVYQEDKPLEAPQTGGIEVVVMMAGGSDILYKNLKEERFTSQSDVFGKIFLVKDTLAKQNWTLEKDTKSIGEYTCHKATMKRMMPVIEARVSNDGNKDLENENGEPEMREVTVTAWYTMQIPITTGPDRYHGLPGLILEVSNGIETTVCSKIVLNPKEKVIVKEPIKGKEINQEDFQAIVEKKRRELRGGNSFDIRFGGY